MFCEQDKVTIVPRGQYVCFGSKVSFNRESTAEAAKLHFSNESESLQDIYISGQCLGAAEKESHLAVGDTAP